MSKKISKSQEPKVVTSAKISKPKDVSTDALEEITLLKDHGFDKKGTKLMRHPNTAYLLKINGIAK